MAPTRLVKHALERWPTAQALAAASREDVIGFARAQHSGYQQRFADLLQQALAEDHFIAPAHLAAAKAGTIRLLARQLLLIDAQRKTWEKRMGQLLLGTPTGPQEDQPGQAFPGGEIYLSFPGLGRRLAATIAGEIGEHIEQFTAPNSLQCYAGRAPVTRRSGKRDLVVAQPPRLQSLPRRCDAQMGLRQPPPLGLAPFPASSASHAPAGATSNANERETARAQPQRADGAA